MQWACSMCVATCKPTRRCHSVPMHCGRMFLYCFYCVYVLLLRVKPSQNADFPAVVAAVVIVAVAVVLAFVAVVVVGCAGEPPPSPILKGVPSTLSQTNFMTPRR
eukprot:COSAG05_NODE_623_length_8291_cov_4.353394_2_plen_105_part_00